MGVVECRQHGLVEPFNVLWEKEGQFWSHALSFTLLQPRRDFKLGLKGGNSTQVQTEIVDIDRLAVPVLKLT